jgi:hypothetical protein
MNRAVWAALLFITVAGCDLQPSAPQQIVTPVPPPKPVVLPNQLVFSELEMRSSNKFSVSGDLRPHYVVSGRVFNTSRHTITLVRLFVQIYDAAGKKDSAILNLKTEILPDETQAFQQEVQILPPAGKWNWQYEALSVDARD